MDVNFVKTYFSALFTTGDIDGDSRISQQEFEDLLVQPGVAVALQGVGVDVIGLVDFIDFIFKGGYPLSLDKFLDIVLQLRGSNRASVRDIVELRKFLITELSDLQADVMFIVDACRIGFWGMQPTTTSGVSR